jgi:hypothetical protein
VEMGYQKKGASAMNEDQKIISEIAEMYRWIEWLKEARS